MVSEDKYRAFYTLLDALGDEEFEVLTEVARGLLDGQAMIGKFNLGSDYRDFVQEADEEDRDWLVYRAAAIIQERRKRADKAH